MALLDNVVKQRMVGALVLVALAVVFLPMLFSRPDEMREVRVNAPAAPAVPVVPQVKVQPAAVPDAPAPTPVVDEAPPSPPVTARASSQARAPSMPISAAPTVTAPSAPSTKTAAPAAVPTTPAPSTSTAPTAKADVASKLDAGGVPVSWSVQLASLSNRAGADTLQKTLRTQGYNAYVRSAEGKNRVFVGPLIDRGEAERLRDVINRQQNLKGFVVRFEPERG
ncbi:MULTISPECIES: SPOR domain-containing protein [Pseudomonas]|uniref:SPOR domain-containing protein n=1 Tax=Pseudomonas quercus TaxID=2722792 RepID=A0ABX0Y9C3_9PSED|nr:MULTISPECIES: SPOR domain-containing protein [Pseudomonas]MBF7141361.1 SPOR domain-containing protein [Pseudomonas sp. LY10J]NJO99899.1 SPOR domain-containing protein [Pseudomonas quercus]